MATPPTLGSAKPGNLYADLASRALWLGVDPIVDPGGAVLISDIMALQEQIEDASDEAQAYTDAQISTRAPTVHNHTSAQITDLTAVVTSIVLGIPGLSFYRGMIMMFVGSLAEIGVGDFAGWQLCDGSNGTPDLRDKFILGAGNKPNGAVNPQNSLKTDVKGGHTHVVAGHVLTTAQIPAHAHGVSDPGHAHSVYDPGHAHSYTANHQPIGSIPAGGNAGRTAHTSTTAAAGTGISIYAAGTGIGIQNAGGGGSHAHGLSTDGSHDHDVTSLNLRETIPYYALAFIMRL